MKKIVVSVWLVLASALSWALPTVQQVEAAVQQGHYAQAEGMMREVVDAKPGSAKGHYIYAEILAHNGRFAQAAEEARKARQLDPDIKFTQPDKFQAFEKLLEREQKPTPRADASNTVLPAAAAAPAPTRAAGVPTWVWGASLALVGYLLWRGFSRSRAAPSPGTAPAFAGPAAVNGFGGYAAPGMGSAGSAPSAMPAASPSSGLMRTGLAVAGGVAAGMLVDEMLHRRPSAGTDQISSLQHGIFDAPPTDNAADELERRSVDFGNGADWDAGGGGADLGGGGSDGGGWD